MRPPAVKSSRQGSAVSTRNVSAPLVSSATEPSVLVLPACPGSPRSGKPGPRSSPPAWWVARTPITPSAGEKHSTVSSGLFSVWPRRSTGRTAA